MKNSLSLLVFVLMTMITSTTLFGNSKVTGKVIDKETGIPLPGANVFLENTSIGTATNVEGKYILSNLEVGKYTLQIKYLGYEPQSFEVEILANTSIEINAELSYMTIEGEEVLVTGQAVGQMQAINQQITSLSVVNVVSSAKIQELPEANAAEAVGRLPGISLQREGGEGNKVVIRGLSPQYNKISLNGVNMAATGNEDRSVDLSMISPHILDGIEVSKTAMADQEADQLGGSVNFVLRGAPEKPTLNFSAQGGYNGLRNEVNNYYYVLGGGMRFLDNKLGVFFQANLEKTDRSSNSANAGYAIQYDSIAIANRLELQDISRTNQRRGGVLVLDYVLATTKIKLSSTINNNDVNTFLRQEQFEPVGRTHNYFGEDSERSLFVMINSLNLEQSLGWCKIIADFSYSRSKTDIPSAIRMNAAENNAFTPGWSWDNSSINPFEISEKALNRVSQSVVNQFYQSSSISLEEESSAKLNFETKFQMSFAEIDLKVGGEFKHKYKKYNYEQYEIPLAWQDMALPRLYLSQKFNLSGYDYANEDFPYAPFIDNNYDAGDFKSGGSYIINRVPNRDLMVEVYNDIKNLTTVNGTPVVKSVWYDYTDSNLNDYYGSENYYAAYILPKITLYNNKVSIIPGFRYEHVETEYTANRSNGPGKPTDPFVYFEHTAIKKNDYLLPMIHVKYQVFDWFDIRASYTQTLARPNYNRLIPTWSTFGSNITWNNVELKPAKSQNFDIFFSFYSDKIGLLGLGVFEKQIEDFTFATTTFISDISLLQPEWPSTVAKGGQINEYINSPDMAKLRGFEIEWQSNFWFLPGVLKGLVMSANYTYTESRTKYPKFVPVYETLPGPIPIKKLVGTEDKGYYDRLLDQPTHILNFTVGFDYKDFSIRGSYQYKSNVFVTHNFFEQLRSSTDPLSLWDVKIAQKLPFEGMQVFLNVNNISESVDQTSNYGTGWFTNRSYYGLSADLGISYSFN